ncbi:MAG: hypothetical protein KF726_07075 [Anaerolineae bacterium]|nr:hypothetical protein [Anaerolineae bacterium]
MTFAVDRPFAALEYPLGKPVANLFLFSSVHTVGGREDTTSIGEWQVLEQSASEFVLQNTTSSSIWERKTVRLRCSENRIVYELEVQGSSRITEIDYFSGYYSAQPRWGSGFFWSGQEFMQGYNPEPNTDEVFYFEPAAGSLIDLTGVPLPGKGTWFFTPPPYSFAFQSSPEHWLGMSIEAAPNNNRYGDYRYRGMRGCFGLNLAYQVAVNDVQQLPSIAVDFASDEYSTVERHANALRRQGYAPTVDRRNRPSWWESPMFCGWGAQCYLAAIGKLPAPAYARQEYYDAFLRDLETSNILPTIITIDDKWQAAYGTNEVDTDKWHDLRGFIDAQHRAGRKVLLWLKAWDAEGLPAEETVRNAAGLPISVDPTNPQYQQRLRDSIRWMLSAQGYDADGFKIDFTARIPDAPGMQIHADVYGLELMKLYLQLIYEAAKTAKSDALIVAHTPHPYLADVVDVIRLNDINTNKDVVRAMKHRARIARIAGSQAIIDTDNWPITDRASWRAYMRIQATLGVPSLYYVTHIDATQEPLLPEDYALIRDVWASHQTQSQNRAGSSASEIGSTESI